MNITIRMVLILSSFAVVLAIATFLAAVSPALATTDYAIETGQECSICHISSSGGGGLTQAGESYSEDAENWKAPAGPAKKIPVYLRVVHMIILYAHVFFGIIWIGTILYVHLVLKPKYALGGLPRAELRLAWLSMPMLGLTGVLLTMWRLQLAPGLFTTMFGKLLLAKITVFLLMVSSATFVTLYIGPRLKALVAHHGSVRDISGKDRFTPEELEDYDGVGDSKTLIAAMDKVYDVSPSPMWKGGVHARRHKAGQDLTEYLDGAPHGPEVLDRYEKVGEFVKVSAKVPAVVRIFTVNAYFNLIGCFLIVLILALWRW
ncbi:MAG: cytochrome b5 domain-containing protein [bacterium]|nr:cytochrome b5 domain-containing protein [bacterium]MDT8365171.1 cytochrome b5 domain-containing protein [bacterium]